MGIAEASSAPGAELQPTDQIVSFAESAAWSGGPITLDALMSGYRTNTLSPCTPRRSTESPWVPELLGSNSSIGVAYLCVARAGSESIQKALQRDYNWSVPHQHGCTLEDLKHDQARRVIVLVRHPAERFISTVSRHRGFDDEFWHDFKSAGALVTALRLEDDPTHTKAYSYSTQYSYAMPIVEYYLQPMHVPGIEIEYVCTNNMAAEYNVLAAKWDLEPMVEYEHKSPTSASDNPRGQFSPENFKWLEDLYSEDVKLCRSKCADKCLD